MHTKYYIICISCFLFNFYESGEIGFGKEDDYCNFKGNQICSMDEQDYSMFHNSTKTATHGQLSFINPPWSQISLQDFSWNRTINDGAIKMQRLDV
jgi:hypothetical protein